MWKDPGHRPRPELVCAHIVSQWYHEAGKEAGIIMWQHAQANVILTNRGLLYSQCEDYGRSPDHDGLTRNFPRSLTSIACHAGNAAISVHTLSLLIAPFASQC